MKKRNSAKSAGIIALAAREETSGFSALTCTPSKLTAEMNRLAKSGRPDSELRVAYLAGIEFARCAIAASTGNFAIYHEPTRDEIMSPEWTRD